MIPRISIIIPTIGRHSILATMLSVHHQLGAGDEILVVGDGSQPWTKDLIETAGPKYQYMETVMTKRWGDPQRAVGMAVAKGDYLAFMDDDDVYLPGALDSMRRAVQEDGSDFFLFKIKYFDRLLWETHDIVAGNVSSQMVLIRNQKDRLGLWAPDWNSVDKRGGDLNFMQSSERLLYPKRVNFRQEVIAQLRQHSYGS